MNNKVRLVLPWPAHADEPGLGSRRLDRQCRNGSKGSFAVNVNLSWQWFLGCCSALFSLLHFWCHCDCGCSSFRTLHIQTTEPLTQSVSTIYRSRSSLQVLQRNLIPFERIPPTARTANCCFTSSCRFAELFRSDQNQRQNCKDFSFVDLVPCHFNTQFARRIFVVFLELFVVCCLQNCPQCFKRRKNGQWAVGRRIRSSERCIFCKKPVQTNVPMLFSCGHCEHSQSCRSCRFCCTVMDGHLCFITRVDCQTIGAWVGGRWGHSYHPDLVWKISMGRRNKKRPKGPVSVRISRQVRM